METDSYSATLSESATAGLVSLTYRFRPEIATALRRAAAERKRSGQAPCTQQHIVEDALVRWLRDHGYMP